MSAAPLVAGLLARAFPGLQALDLTGAFLPFLPAARAILPPPPDPSEAALMADFAPSAATLAALQAGAPAAWGEGQRLLILPGATPPAAWDPTWAPVVAAGALTLHPGAAVAGESGGQLTLLAETPRGLERHTLLAPAEALAGLLDRLRAAAEAIAPHTARIGGRLISPRLASLTILGTAQMPARFSRPAASLPSTGQNPRRLLLGLLPPGSWTLRLALEAADPVPPALFIDGLRHPAALLPSPGGATLATTISATAEPLILGLAWPGQAPPDLILGLIQGTA